jgi:hypothetical protein
MSVLRDTGDPCPIDETPLSMSLCQTCRFFRGASVVTGYKDWKITCNWPRDGTFLDQRRIPTAFMEAWNDDGGKE